MALHPFKFYRAIYELLYDLSQDLEVGTLRILCKLLGQRFCKMNLPTASCGAFSVNFGKRKELKLVTKKLNVRLCLSLVNTLPQGGGKQLPRYIVWLSLDCF